MYPWFWLPPSSFTSPCPHANLYFYPHYPPSTFISLKFCYLLPTTTFYLYSLFTDHGSGDEGQFSTVWFERQHLNPRSKNKHQQNSLSGHQRHIFASHSSIFSQSTATTVNIVFQGFHRAQILLVSCFPCLPLFAYLSSPLIASSVNQFRIYVCSCSTSLGYGIYMGLTVTFNGTQQLAHVLVLTSHHSSVSVSFSRKWGSHMYIPRPLQGSGSKHLLYPTYEMLLRCELILSLKAHVIFTLFFFFFNTELDAQLEEEAGKEA